VRNLLTVEYPPITSFPSIANLLSSIWINKDVVMSWFADRYIQLISRTNEPDWLNFLDGLYLNNTQPADFCPFCTTQTIDKRVPLIGSGNFTDFIEQQIDCGYYIDTCLNHYFLKCSSKYNNEHFMHATFIYGYDKANKQIMISDFYDSGKYQSKIASYDEINKSFDLKYFNNWPGWIYGINLYKYVDFPYKTNIPLLKQSLEDYISGVDSQNKYYFSYQWSSFADAATDDSFYGVGCYDAIINYCNESNSYLDNRTFHVIYDHKAAMQLRLEFLKKLGYLKSGEQTNKLDTMVSKLKDEAFVLRNMVLKYNINRRNSLLKSIMNKCEILKENDIAFTSLFLQQIK